MYLKSMNKRNKSYKNIYKIKKEKLNKRHRDKDN